LRSKPSARLEIIGSLLHVDQIAVVSSEGIVDEAAFLPHLSHRRPSALERSEQESSGQAMVPAHYESFFSAMSTGGATLLGLLFVAVSIRRSASADQQQPTEAVVLADATLFALANGFVVSSAALHPKLNVAYVALPISALGFIWLIRVFGRFRRAWATNSSAELRRYRFRVVAPNLVGPLLNGCQVTAGVRLAMHPGDDASMGLLAAVVLGCYSLALLRAWALTGGTRHGLRGAFSEARRSPSRVLLRESNLPRSPHVHPGRGGLAR
jgi:hypothetical protein